MSSAEQVHSAPGGGTVERRMPGPAELSRRLRTLREDPHFLESAMRIRSDAEDPAVRDGLIWSLLVEPGDGVAGALVAALGASDALEIAFGGGERDPAAASQDDRPAVAALRDARRRWMPRLEPAPQLAAVRTAARIGARLLLPGDPEWPTRLADLGAHAPLALWLRGDATVLSARGYW